jgi:hypothetical protein
MALSPPYRDTWYFHVINMSFSSLLFQARTMVINDDTNSHTDQWPSLSLSGSLTSSTFLGHNYFFTHLLYHDDDASSTNGPNLVKFVSTESTILVPSLEPHRHRCTSHESQHSIVPGDDAFPKEGIRSLGL